MRSPDGASPRAMERLTDSRDLALEADLWWWWWWRKKGKEGAPSVRFGRLLLRSAPRVWGVAGG